LSQPGSKACLRASYYSGGVIMEWIAPVLIFVAYFVFVRWVLPYFGVST
jgi:hypothetical protein